MILRIEAASQLRFHSQNRKIIRGNNSQADASRLRQTGKVIVVVPGRRRVFENSRVLKVLPLGLRHSDVPGANPWKIILNADELLGVRIRQRMQQGRIDDAEDCGGGANPQRDRQDRDHCETRRFAQHPKAEANVLEQRIDKIPAERFAAFFLESFRTSELDPGAAFRFTSGEADALELVRAKVNVRLQLLLQFAFRFGAMKKTRAQRSEKRNHNHSLCMATIGSTREARQAGTRHAQTEIKASSATAAE